jgi:hypothetical protein
MTSFRLALAVASASVLAAPSQASDWVQITKPMVACEAIEDNPNLATGVIVYLATGTKEEGCEALKVGDKLELDGELKSTGVVKFWRPVCKPGCSPFMTPVYAPLRSRVGNYYRKTSPPKGWD